MKISEHSLIMNMVIGLCRETHGWPNVLKNLSYNLDWIEPRLINSEGKKVSPDLMFTSNKYLHVLISECKGGRTLSEEQSNKFLKLTGDSVRDRANVYDPSKIELEVCYAALEDNLEDLLASLKPQFPVLSFSNSLKKHNNFKSRHLEDAFNKEIQLDGNPPISYIPFTDEDDEELIFMYVVREIVTMTFESGESEMQFDPEEILVRIHPLWNNLDESAKKRLRNKVRKIIGEINKKLGAKYLNKIKGKPTWVAKTLQPFRIECEKLLKELESKRTLDDFQ